MARPKLTVVEKPAGAEAYPPQPDVRDTKDQIDKDILEKFSEPEALPNIVADLAQPFADEMRKNQEFDIEIAEVTGNNSYIHVSYRVTPAPATNHEDPPMAVAAFIRAVVDTWKQRLTK